MLSDTIKSRLTERFSAPLPEFHKRRIVFWNDENGEFAGDVDELSLPGVTLIKLTGRNNFAVKKLLAADDLTGDYLIYNPITYDDPQDDWLLDIELYSGEPFLADLISLQMEELGIAPTSAMRKTVKLYAKFLDNKERKAKLRKIGRGYQSELPFHTDIMAVLCGLNGGTAQDVIIAVLSAGLDKESNHAIESITKFGNIDAFRQIVGKFTGYVDTDDRLLIEMAAHILLTALSQTMGAAPLKGLERFISESRTAYCYQLVHEWQSSEGNGALYEICRHVEHELRLSSRFDRLDLGILLKSDTFPAINDSVLKCLLTDIGEKVNKANEILAAVENRRTVAWYSLAASYFDCLYYIALMQKFYISHIQGFHIVEPWKIWKFYTGEGYRMDSYYRHYHYAFGNTLKEPNPLLDDALKKSAEFVEGLYHEWYLKELTASWTEAIAGDMEKLGSVSEITRQREFYSKYVSPALSKGNRVFVLVSDALRYDVAAELAENLNRATKGKATLESVQSVFPSVTEFGMAALLPGKELSVNDKLDVLMDNNPTGSTEYRGAALNRGNVNSAAVNYKEFLQMKQQERRELLQGKEIVYIYHNAIDAVGEKLPTESKVFEACETAIAELTGAVKIIVNDLSGINIFITSDHGFLYTYKPLGESQKISRQTFGGKVYDVGRRYALTPPDTTAEYLLPVNIGREIRGIPIKGWAPLETVRIKIQGGGLNYVHGGVTLQEMAIPVIVYKGMRSGYKKFVEVKNPGLALVSESRKAANLMFSLDFLQRLPVGNKVQPCVYTVYFTDDEGAVISDRQTVIADKASANDTERVIRVRFNLKSMAYSRNKIYRLVISNDTDAPEEIEFRIDIAFADDFGFNL